MKTFYAKSDNEFDRSIEGYRKDLMAISTVVSELGAAWRDSIESSLGVAKPKGLASTTLRPKLRTAQFLMGSITRTEKRINEFSTALREKKGGGSMIQTEAKIDWGRWLEKEKLSKRLCIITKRVTNVKNSISSASKKQQVVVRQQEMKKALTSLVKNLAGQSKIGHAIVSITELVEALHDIYRGSRKSVDRPLKSVVRDLDELQSLEEQLLALECCLYLIPSAQDVEHEDQITAKVAYTRLTKELKEFTLSAAPQHS